MPVTLAQEFVDAIEPPVATDPLIWLVELEISEATSVGTTAIPAVVICLTSHSASVVWPVGAPASTDPREPQETTWYPLPFTFSAIEQTTENDLPQLDLTVDNTARTLMRYLHAGDGMVGNRCTLHLVPLSAISVAHPNHVHRVWTSRVSGCWATEESVTFRLERPNWFAQKLPREVFSATRCRWEHGGAECGYVVNAAAAFPTCAKTLDACDAHGDDERARGLPVLHPGRFGGFPGLPRAR